MRMKPKWPFEHVGEKKNLKSAALPIQRLSPLYHSRRPL
jgi:hypothetical protein